jgi:ribosomal protein S18 acetylase RimI-like enzyme
MSEAMLRRATPADAETIAAYNVAMAMETESLALDPIVVRRGVERAIADEAKAIYFVAEVGGRVVAQLMITHEWSDWRDGDMWWVQSVYVHPDYRRQGLFRRLYEHAATQARAAGAKVIRLYVEQDNAAAQQTYGSLGMHLTHYRVMEQTL